MIVADKTGYLVKVPYNRDFIEDLKFNIGREGRKWDPAQKVWIVIFSEKKRLQMLLDKHYGAGVYQVPSPMAPKGIVRESFQVRYIGMTKERYDLLAKEPLAYGLITGGWNIIFPESVLKNWFSYHGQDTKDLFSILGTTATNDLQKVKEAYRRMARQWHPDVCREENAHEMFIQIKEAYEQLDTPMKIKKYLAASALVASHAEAAAPSPSPAYRYRGSMEGYRSPIRCGVIEVTGELIGMKFHVKEIHSWGDIINDQGQILIASWDRFHETVHEEWVTA
jgi:DnaJ-domain-containing protein 1